MLFFNIQTDYTRKRWGDINEQTDIKNRCNATHHSPQRNQMSPAVFKQRNVAQFHTIRPKRKEPLIKAGSHNRNTHTHTHRQQLFTKAKKNPTDTIVHGRKRTSHLRQQAKLVPDRPRLLPYCHANQKSSLIDISLAATGFFLRGRTAGARVYSIMLRRVLSITKGPQNKQFFLFVCLFANLPLKRQKQKKSQRCQHSI